MLLLAQDQWRVTSMELTHDLIADMLGMRRETVSHAAHALQDQSVLSYRRGESRCWTARRCWRQHAGATR